MTVPPGFILNTLPIRRYYYTDTDIRGRIKSAKDIDYALHAEGSSTSENRFDIIVLRGIHPASVKADLFTLPVVLSHTIEERLRGSKDGDRFMELLVHMYSIAGQQVTSTSLWVHSELIKGSLRPFDNTTAISPRTLVAYLILAAPSTGVQLKRRRHPDPTHALKVGDVVLCGARDDLEILGEDQEVSVLRLWTMKDDIIPPPPLPLATAISRLAIGVKRKVSPPLDAGGSLGLPSDPPFATPNSPLLAGPSSHFSPIGSSPGTSSVTGTPYYRFSDEQLVLHNAASSATPSPSPRRHTAISAFKTSRRMFSTIHSKRPHPANNFPLLDTPIRAFDYTEDRQRSEIRLRSDVQSSKAAPSYSPRKRIKLEIPDVIAAIPSAQLLELGIVGASIRWEAARAGRSRKGIVKKETLGALCEVKVESMKEPLFLEYDSTDSM